MQHIVKTISMGLLAIVVSVSCTETDVVDSEFQKLADSYADVRGFNGSVIVARGDNILVKSSYGNANMEWGIPNSPTVKYRIGSLTKPITATLVMSLVEDGVLSLTGTLGDYLPELYKETAAAEVTVEQLLSHTSAMPDLPRDLNDDWYKTTARHQFDPKDLAREWIEPELLGIPGDSFRYNNAGFILLALIIEEVTGKSFAENLSERIFEPAGMSSSGVFTQAEVIPNMAKGYERLPEGGLKHASPVDPSVFNGAANVYSTLEDLHRFDRILYTGKIVSEETRLSMLSQKSNVPYGFGWGLERVRTGPKSRIGVSSHSGSIPGYQSYYIRSEESEGFVFVTSNTNQGRVIQVMARDLAGVLNGKPMSLAKRDLMEFLSPILVRDGEEAAIMAYKNLGDQLSQYDASEGALNRLGYRFLRSDKSDLAIAVFESNVARNPESANPYDSLGETYRAVGRIDDAITSYEKALILEPKSESAKTALEEMRATGK